MSLVMALFTTPMAQRLEPPLADPRGSRPFSFDDRTQKLNGLAHVTINYIVIIMHNFADFTPGISQATANRIVAIGSSRRQSSLEFAKGRGQKKYGNCLRLGFFYFPGALYVDIKENVLSRPDVAVEGFFRLAIKIIVHFGPFGELPSGLSRLELALG